LYLRVRLAKHPDFEVEDHNLIYEAELAPWEAVLGAKFPVPALDGRVNIKIPAGTQSGQKLRVRGRGLPARGGARGDLFVRHKNRRAGQSHGRGKKNCGSSSRANRDFIREFSLSFYIRQRSFTPVPRPGKPL